MLRSRGNPPGERMRVESDTRIVGIGGARFGGQRFALIAGPCAVESREQLLSVARRLREDGAHVLRGGVFKMRTDPKTFQGLGTEALELIDDAREATGLPFLVEVASPDHIGLLMDHVDAFQVGSRNMHNSYLLKELGATRKPVLLKRGFAATLREWLLAAEYVSGAGNESIVLCERGIRTFGTETRNTLDLAGAVWARQHSSFPVIVDPSHATGRPELIGPMCLASAAAGLDGLMVEVHPSPTGGRVDGFQALTPEGFRAIVRELGPVLAAVGRAP